jgi:hypothetical protein
VRRRESQACPGPRSGIQALDRSQPLRLRRPLRSGQVDRRTHDCKRHSLPRTRSGGTTSPFAALNVATGDVVGKCHKRHRASEFKRFLAEIAARVPAELDIHVVMDDDATYKTAATPTTRRRLRQPQDGGDPRLVGPAAALACSLHADRRRMAQHGRALLCRDHRKAKQARRLPQRKTTADPGLHRTAKRNVEAVPVGEDR